MQDWLFLLIKQLICCNDQGVIVRRLGNWERGVFAVGDGEPRLPDRGLAIRVATPRIDADAWKNYLPEGSNGGADAGGLALNVVSLKTPLLRVFERDFSNVDLTLRPRDSGWQIGLNTREAVGDIFWKSAGEGWVEGNFKRLVVRPAAEIGEGSTTLINTLPGMSLSVDDLHIGDKALGKLELKARNDKGAWNLDTLSLQNPDGALKGKGVWNNTGRHQTRLDFELTAKDAGKLLDRLGYGDTVRRGTARLAGDLQWSGPLTGIHYPSLSGQLAVAADKGLHPGLQRLGQRAGEHLPLAIHIGGGHGLTQGQAICHKATVHAASGHKEAGRAGAQIEAIIPPLIAKQGKGQGASSLGLGGMERRYLETAALPAAHLAVDGL